MKPFILFIALLPLFAFSQDSLSNHYKIYSTSRQKQVSLDEIITDMANADVLFFWREP